MSIKFKSFHDYTSTHQNPGMFGTTWTEPIFATKQAEEFLIENHILDTKIKDIKFSVDSKGNEHILLIYEVPEE